MSVFLAGVLLLLYGIYGTRRAGSNTWRLRQHNRQNPSTSMRRDIAQHRWGPGVAKKATAAPPSCGRTATQSPSTCIPLACRLDPPSSKPPISYTKPIDTRDWSGERMCIGAGKPASVALLPRGYAAWLGLWRCCSAARAARGGLLWAAPAAVRQISVFALPALSGPGSC